MVDIKTQADFLTIERTIVDYLTAEAGTHRVSCDDSGEWTVVSDMGGGDQAMSITALALAVMEALHGRR